MKIRSIKKEDNITIARIIRSSLDSYGLGIEGTVYTDPTTDDLFSLFKAPNSNYFILENNNQIIGGCGIYPTKGLPINHVELVKLYLVEDMKGKGYGEKLMRKCILWAKKAGFTHIYLETLNELSSAVALYEKLGFTSLKSPIGDSGHNACDIWMIKEI